MPRKTKNEKEKNANEEKRKPGRPSKFTDDTKRILISALRRGLPVPDACAAADIHVSTYYRWMAEGESFQTGKRREFYDAATRARGKGRTALADSIYATALKGKVTTVRKPDGTVVVTEEPGDWRAAAFLLRASDPDTWSEKRQLQIQAEVSGKDGGPVEQRIVVDFVGASDEDLEAIAEWDDAPVVAGNGERDE